MKSIKTPGDSFKNIKDFPFTEHYVQFQDLEMHYVDEGEGETILAIHGQPSWSYLYRKFIPVLKDYRFIAPDLIGFGKSDKIIGPKNYSFELHLQSLVNLIEQLELKDITLIVQDWGGLLGLSLLAEFPERFKRVVILNTFLPRGKPLPFIFKLWVAFAKYHPSAPVGKIIQFGSHNKLSKDVIAAYDAPFPNKKYKDGIKSFPALVPGKPTDEAVPYMLKARKVLSEWKKPALVLFSDKDKVFSGMEKFFYRLIPSTNEYKKITIKNAGHFLQEEKGEEIAAYVDVFMKGGLKV